jgi:uncharacterized membrane protein
MEEAMSGWIFLIVLIVVTTAIGVFLGRKARHD